MLAVIHYHKNYNPFGETLVFVSWYVSRLSSVTTITIAFKLDNVWCNLTASIQPRLIFFLNGVFQSETDSTVSSL